MRRIGQLTFILFLAAALPFGASAKEKIKYLFAWDDRHPATPVMGHGFAKRITKASNGEITFSFCKILITPLSLLMSNLAFRSLPVDLTFIKI